MIILDKNIDKEILKELKKLNKEIIFTEENKALMPGINTHPDILIRPLEGKDIIVDRDNLSYYKKLLENYNIIPSEKSLKRSYPYDVALNFVLYKGYLIHNLSFTDRQVIDYCKKRNYKFIDVKQGYTKCNIVVGKNSLITSDKDIYEKLKEEFNVLLIKHKNIDLKGFNYGFIGGASGLIDDVLYFTGDFLIHPCGKEINSFLNENREEFKILSKNKLVDYGSILNIS
ncbi:DUF6873 family GME fold protein [Peptoniphilus catoniae]|uniref:DUF6873 family GME fold protein n=1 Tax=Peptoniphilus catoniae TaxID=1660341 RepID=UPI0010FE4347|nr:hypothetical protein [Peptoniphilus catoniae]